MLTIRLTYVGIEYPLSIESIILYENVNVCSRIMEEGFVECTLFYCFHEKMAYVTETVKSHLADFTSVSQLVSQNEKVHTRWGWCEAVIRQLTIFVTKPRPKRKQRNFRFAQPPNPLCYVDLKGTIFTISLQ